MAANTYLTSEERTLLESARVGIAGAGGLGSNCAMHLVRAGVKHLTVVDFDVVNESNLNRQFFFRDQIGQKKMSTSRPSTLGSTRLRRVLSSQTVRSSWRRSTSLTRRR